MKKVFLLLFVSVLTAKAFAQGIAFEPETSKWADILAKAKASNKVVFVDAYTTWCGPCKMMAKNTFPLKEVGDFYNAKFVNAKIDMEKGEGVDIAKQYSVQAYPTYLFVDGDGNLVHKGIGYLPAEKFLEVGGAAADPSRQFYTLKKRYDAGDKNPAFLKDLAVAAEASMENELASKAATAYLATQKDWSSAENMRFIAKFATDLEGEPYKYAVKNRAAFVKEVGALETEALINYTAIRAVVTRFFNRTNGTFDSKAATDYLTANLPKEAADEVISLLKVQESQMKNDQVATAKAAAAHFDKYPTHNPSLLNEYAWSAYENITDPTLLKKALKWSLQSVELDPQYAYMDTAASIYFKLGQKKEAKAMAERAIEAAKKGNEDASATENLLKEIEKLK